VTGAAGPAEAVIGLGSNLGRRLAHLRAAVAGLRRLGRVVAVSALYETAPVGGPPQGPYLNAVAVLATDRSSREVLDGLLEIERSQGRRRAGRWGPRTLDLDLLLHGDRVVSEPGLEVPHPLMAGRRFVLEPLLEVRPDATLPDGTPVAPFLAEVAGQEVRRIREPDWAQ